MVYKTLTVNKSGGLYSVMSFVNFGENSQMDRLQKTATVLLPPQVKHDAYWMDWLHCATLQNVYP